uniref:FAD/NAD(P)-binding domain-containing protein n=1 Tax=Bionectria ochroleuca TaxID=29856 RepID=A0A8H7KCV7_BIOOC
MAPSSIDVLSIAQANGIETGPVVEHIDNVSPKKDAADAQLNGLYKIIEQPLGQRKHIRIACLGAGYSGLMMAIIFSRRLQGKNAEFVIYERNEDLGGTWLENRYPGCKCDIPAHNYAYSFAPKPNWPNYYATSEQIHQYMHDVAKQYDCEKYVKYNHSIRSAAWVEDISKWQLTVEKTAKRLTFVDEVDIFINAGGVLNNWKWPTIPGLSSFEGNLVHSAKWDTEYDFSGKRVALIGIGSSGIQIAPQLANISGSLDLFVRSQTWISPGPGINEPTANDPEMDDEYNFSEAALELFKDPQFLRDYRSAMIDRRNVNYKRWFTDSEEQTHAVNLFRESMKQRLGDSEKGRKAAELLLPSFPVGCRRPTPGPGFLECLVKDNVELRWDDIQKITSKGILTKNYHEREYDVIVCATGFDTSFKPAFPIIGRSNISLAEKWTKELPRAYFSVAVPEFPNYFCFIGPNTVINNGSLVLGIQMTAVYIYRWIEKMQTELLKSIEVRQEANDEFNEHIQTYLQRTVWTGNCRSWYKHNGVDGPVTAVYGGTTFHYMEALKNPRWEDFHIVRDPETKRNRFAYLGNGFTLNETNGKTVGVTQTVDLDEFLGLFVLPSTHG